MMTLAVRDGDLVLDGDRFQMVEGTPRIQQTLSLCLRERTGVDRFHPGWGSSLPNMIGTARLADTPQRIQSEVTRVVNNVAASQAAFVRGRTSIGRTPPVTADEMLSGIVGISTTAIEDTVSVSVSLRTMGRNEFSILMNEGV